MDPESQVQQPVQTETPLTPSGLPTTPPTRPNTFSALPYIIGIAIFCILLVILGIGFVSSPIFRRTKPTITPTPTVSAPTPTPMKQLSPVATQSAFFDLEGSVASLSSDLATYQSQDPSLNPPVLDLPLGFSR